MIYLITIVALIVAAFLSAVLWMPRSWYRAMLYPGGRPNALAGWMNSVSARIFAAGISPKWVASLETVGRRTGRVYSAPVVIAEVAGEQYLVSMLGQNASWVQNVRAAGGIATLRHGRVEEVRLEEVPVGERAPILKAYLRAAPGARPHIEIDLKAELSEFAKIAPLYPVFRITRPGD
ncbi:MAG: nitroreductase/quinone reductase family protein [Candidatus Binatus sp.]